MSEHRDLIDWARRQTARISPSPSGSPSPGGGAGGDGGLMSVAIPNYTLLGEVHRGGQGVVYRARQESTQRDVAIKVLSNSRFASRSARLRFAREVQILCDLRHPNVVTVHDSGEADGQPWFAMDYIAGAPLDVYADSHPLSVERALTLGAQIAEAVNAAHLRGVIHRDLKPSNIRVDEDGVPHVLDFGLAKSTEDPGRTTTEPGMFIGSLLWSSPEQVRGAHQEIDARSDVYALGLILYRLLTGDLPYAAHGSHQQIMAQILDSDPPPPGRLRPEVDHETDTIVRKCLARDPERRYQSAGELARDLRRRLAGAPIDAKRDSMVYLLRKQLGRHRTAAGLGVALLVAVVGGAAVSLRLWRQAVGDRDTAERAQVAESVERARAESRAAEAEAITAFLTDLLTSADPADADGRQLTVREVLDRAAAEIAGGALSGRANVEAAVRDTLGQTYESLGAAEAAEEQYRAALALRRSADPPVGRALATSLTRLGGLLTELGSADEAEVLVREAVELLRSEPDPPVGRLAEALTVLGRCAQLHRRFEEAEALHGEVLTLLRGAYGPNHEGVASALNNLGLCRMNQGRFAEAASAFRDALQVFRELGVGRSVGAAIMVSNVGQCALRTGDAAQAEPYLRESLEIFEHLFQEPHPLVATAQHMLGRAQAGQGRLAEAEALFRAALETRQAVLPAGHPAIGATQVQLASVLVSKGDLQVAEGMLRAYLADEAEAELPNTTYNRINARAVLSDALVAQGRVDEAEELLRTNYGLVVGDERFDAATVRRVIERLAEFHEGQQQAERAGALRAELAALSDAPGAASASGDDAP